MAMTIGYTRRKIADNTPPGKRKYTQALLGLKKPTVLEVCNKGSLAILKMTNIIQYMSMHPIADHKTLAPSFIQTRQKSS